MIGWLSAHSARLLRAVGGIAVLALLGWTPAAHAASVNCTVSMSSLGFGTVYVPGNAVAGTPIGPTVTASAFFSCDTKFNGADGVTFSAVVNGAPVFDTPTTGTITFTTNVPGIALQLTPSNPGIAGYTSNAAFPAGVINSIYTTTTQNYSAQLVTTGAPLSPGPLNQILVGGYSVVTSGGGKADFTQNGALVADGKIMAGGCNITNVNVTLPTITTSQLGVTGATTGLTPVPLNLSGCPASTKISISFSGTAATMGGVSSTTVLASTGTAGNVGVQLLDGSGQPVDITGTVATPLGQTSSSGTMTPNPGYAARYYATGAATPGSVFATATYTLTYQ